MIHVITMVATIKRQIKASYGC